MVDNPTNYTESGQGFEDEICGTFPRKVTLHNLKSFEELNVEERELYRQYLEEKLDNEKSHLFTILKKDPAYQRLSWKERVEKEEKIKNIFFDITEKIQEKGTTGWQGTPENPPENLPAIKEIIKNLKLELNNIPPSEIRYYTTVKNPLDSIGIDCYFKIGPTRITVDIKNFDVEDKDIHYRSDVLLGKPDVAENQIYSKIAEEGSKKIIKAYREKVSEMEEGVRQETVRRYDALERARERRREGITGEKKIFIKRK